MFVCGTQLNECYFLQDNVLGASKLLKEEIEQSYHDALTLILKEFERTEKNESMKTQKQQILLVLSVLTMRLTSKDLSLVVTSNIAKCVHENIDSLKEFCLQFLKALTVQVVYVNFCEFCVEHFAFDIL